MKKIIVTILALCLPMFGAFAQVSRIVSKDVQNAWGFGFGEETDLNINTTFKKSTDITSRNAFHITGAKNIYENGAEFCSMLIDHESTGGLFSTKSNWHAYIYKDTCKTICKSGFSGSECKTLKKADSCDTTDLSSTFKQTGTRADSGINGFYSDDYDIVILVATEVEEHQLKVYPIQFSGQPKDGDKSKKDIKRILNRATDNKFKPFILCAPGYTEKDGKCKCDTDQQSTPDNNEGSNSTNCEENKLSGTDSNGKCINCKIKEEIFSGNKCKPAQGITKSQMKSCWGKEDFSNCVKGQQ